MWQAKTTKNIKINIQKLLFYFTIRICWSDFKKIIPTLILFFFISFVYHLLRCLKITLILKADGSSTEIIPFIKFWLVTPTTVLFTYIYTKLAKYSNREFLIYNILIIFIVFFILFFLLFTQHKAPLNFSLLHDLFNILHIKNYHKILSILATWPEILFYIMAEMWGVIVLSILFWGFCNETTKIAEAKRFYTFIALGANCAGIFSGKFMQFITNSVTHSWEESRSVFIITIIINCILILFLFIKLNKNAVNLVNIKNINSDHYNSLLSNDSKISLIESIKYIFKYKYIALLALIVMSYNIVFNLSDLLWLNKLNQTFLNANDLNNYLAELDFLVGIFSLIIGIFIFNNLIIKLGWTKTALITPIVWFITSTMLYIFLGIEKFGLPFPNLILILGTLQISLGRAIKYTIFDQIKEMAFIPLSIEQQRNSKAGIDGIISKLAKSLSSIIIQGILILGFNNITEATSIIAVLIILTIFILGIAINKMGILVERGKFY